MAIKTKLGQTNMVLYNVHIIYRVFGGKKLSPMQAGAKQSMLQKVFDNTKKHVGAISSVHAVRGVSFSCRKGETIGIIGRNGAGKSTILRAMAGILPYSKGSIYSKGKSSLLGVNAALIPNLTGERNIMLGGLALGLSPKQIKKQFDDIVEFSGIGDFVYLPMTAYSSGMAARLRFAISVSKIPDILMIDEALSTGDVAFRRKSEQRVKEIKDQAGTVFLVSHSMDSVADMCQRSIWLEHGQIVMDGPTDIVLDSYDKFIQENGKKG